MIRILIRICMHTKKQGNQCQSALSLSSEITTNTNEIAVYLYTQWKASQRRYRKQLHEWIKRSINRRNPNRVSNPSKHTYIHTKDGQMQMPLTRDWGRTGNKIRQCKEDKASQNEVRRGEAANRPEIPGVIVHIQMPTSLLTSTRSKTGTTRSGTQSWAQVTTEPLASQCLVWIQLS